VAAIFLVWTVLLAFGEARPLAWLVLLLAGVAAVLLIGSVAANTRDREGWAFGLGAFTIVSAVLALWFALFPFVMPSTTDPSFSLTIENASSTDYTLTIMSWAALIFLPLVLAYQAWTYWIFRKRVSRTRIERAAAVVH
jgi:cytochrome d ubiquinol oxidase subunit II